MKKAPFAAFLPVAAVLAACLGGCAAGAPPAATPAPSFTALPTPAAAWKDAWQPPGEEALEELERALLELQSGQGESGRYLTYSCSFEGVLTPEEAAALGLPETIMLEPAPGSPQLVRCEQYLSEHPGSQIAALLQEYEYTPETASWAPSFPPGAMRSIMRRCPRKMGSR